MQNAIKNSIDQAAQKLIEIWSENYGMNFDQFERAEKIMAEVGLHGMGIWAAITGHPEKRGIGISWKEPVKPNQIPILLAMISKIAETHSVCLRGELWLLT